MGFIRTIVAFVVLINIIVFVHEFGHFFVARRCGITVKEFALGMGPALFKRKGKNGTVYALRVVPIGGYVSMVGEDEHSDDEGSFSKKKPWQKFLVVGAGAFNNILLTVLIFVALAGFFGATTLEIDQVFDGFAFKEAGVEPGDVIRSIDGKRVRVFEQVAMTVEKSQGPMKIELSRDGKLYEVTVTAQTTEKGKLVGFKPTITKNPLSIVSYSYHKTVYFVGEMYGFLGQLFTGKASRNDVAGPIGLAGVVGETASYGIVPLIMLAAFLSLNLGVINLLPFPALDGGRLVFILYEMIRGKPFPENKEGFVHMVGFLILIGLILFVSFNDVMRLL